MARKPPPEHTRWKPGQSGNKSGRPKRLFTAETLAGEIERCMLMTTADLSALLADPSTKGVTAVAASAALQAIKEGNWNAINSMLDRCIGKVKEVTEVHQHNYDEELDKIPKENIIDILRRANAK